MDRVFGVWVVVLLVLTSFAALSSSAAAGDTSGGGEVQPGAPGSAFNSTAPLPPTGASPIASSPGNPPPSPGNLTGIEPEGGVGSASSGPYSAELPAGPSAPAAATSTDLPAWSYMSDKTTISDPINLVWNGAAWTVVRDALLNQGWAVTTCQWDEYVSYSGTWRKQDVGLEKNPSTPCAVVPGSTRMHLRLWGLTSSLVVADAHLDYQPLAGHVAVQYEEIETQVARDMRFNEATPWRVQEDYYPNLLSNWVQETRNGYFTYNDAFPTTVWLQTGVLARIYDGLTTTLLNIPSWGGIREINNNQVQVYSTSGTVRWSLWYAQTYTSGSVASGGATTVNYPHWTAWMMTIGSRTPAVPTWVRSCARRMTGT